MLWRARAEVKLRLVVGMGCSEVAGLMRIGLFRRCLSTLLCCAVESGRDLELAPVSLPRRYCVTAALFGMGDCLSAIQCSE
jgi:hypothetical protein